MIKPDWNNSILNISATISEYLGVKTEKSKLPIVQEALKKDSKNILFLICDGMGVYDINTLIPNGLFANNIKQVITSTMPATTTNATTSMLTGKYPNEHFWLGWSLYLKDKKCASDIYLSSDSYTGAPVEDYFLKHPYEFYGKNATSKRKIVSIVPPYAKNGFVNPIYVESIEDLFLRVNEQLQDKTEKFIYAYCDEPDHTFHHYGVNSKEGKEVLEKIQSLINKIYEENQDFTIIITADHGHIDITKNIEIYKDSIINNMLERPLSMDSRFVSFKIKDGKKEQFVEYFTDKYGQYFEIVKAENLIESNTFGLNSDSQSLMDFLGDYIAIGNSANASMVFSDKHTPLLGNHAGGTKEEMEVPLIVLQKD